MIEEKIYRVEGFRIQVIYAGDQYVARCNLLPGFNVAFPRTTPDKDFFISLKRKIIQRMREDLEISFGRRSNVIQISAYRMKTRHLPRRV